MGCPLGGSRHRHSILQGLPRFMSSCSFASWPWGPSAKNPFTSPPQKTSHTEKPQTQRTAPAWLHQAHKPLWAAFGGVCGPGGRRGLGRWLHFPALSAKAAAHVLGRAGLGKAGASEGLPSGFCLAAAVQKAPSPPSPCKPQGLSSCRQLWMVGSSAGRQRLGWSHLGHPATFGTQPCLGGLLLGGSCPGGSGGRLHLLLSRGVS